MHDPDSGQWVLLSPERLFKVMVECTGFRHRLHGSILNSFAVYFKLEQCVRFQKFKGSSCITTPETDIRAAQFTSRPEFNYSSNRAVMSYFFASLIRDDNIRGDWT